MIARVGALVVALALGVAGLGSPGRAQAVGPPLPADSVVLSTGRFTVWATTADARLARSVLQAALSRDSFPGLARPRRPVRIEIAPSAAVFTRLVGEGAPAWGAAFAFPEAHRLVLQGGRAGSDAGDPLVVVRHELAHLALHEALRVAIPRWFDEGYASVAAGEWTREAAFETAVEMTWRGLPGVDALDVGFHGTGTTAEWHYALAHRAVAELLALGGDRGLANFFAVWNRTGSLERSLREAYGLTGEGFDRWWHERTRRRYGTLALVTNLSLALGLVTLALAPFAVARRRRDRARLAAWQAHEAQQEKAARDSMLEALLADTPADRTVT